MGKFTPSGKEPIGKMVDARVIERVRVSVLGLPDTPGVTEENEQVPDSFPKLEQSPENVTAPMFVVLGPSRFSVTVAELAVDRMVRLGFGGVAADSERVSATSMRLVGWLLDGSATEVAVKVTVTGVDAALAGYVAGAV